MEDSMDLVNEPQSQQGNKHEVFLSYTCRGEDTQDSFRSRLSSSLRKAKISVYEDDISIELLQNMTEGSKTLIVLFSKHYASSKRCFEELTKIMEFRRAYDQVVLPIFYGVGRSEVKVCNEKSSFGQAFHCLIRQNSLAEDEVSRWRTALNEAGGLHGFVVPNANSNLEGDYIQNIVERVRQILGRKGSFDTDGLVGVNSQVREVITMFQKHQSKDFASIGIWGMAGIGKTTIARLVFDYIGYEFESTCFLSNVREKWKWEGKVHLQKELLSAICEATDMKIESLESAIPELMKRLGQKKALVVLDDVIQLEQLQALCGSPFGEGSRIIITTTDSRLLEAFKVDDVYSVKLLDENASLLLFRRIAFEEESPEGKVMEHNKEVVAHTEGLPLALKDLGSTLRGQSIKQWKLELMKLSIIPLPGIYNQLKCRFDSLEDQEKEIFLDIVFFYIGEKKGYVIRKLGDRGCNASIGIQALVDQSLVTIDKNNKLQMHKMLQLMGRKIIRQSPRNELLKGGHEHEYEVFLSFRGKDTRKTITSHLDSALRDSSIKVYKDDVELPRGNHIKMELLKAIGSSKIAIIIFSENYAESKWCLEELSIIMKLHKSNHQVVLPVFYHVAPTEVRNQTSRFGKAFEIHDRRISSPQLYKWCTALREAGKISGLHVDGSSDEAKIVTTLVEDVLVILDKKDRLVAEQPVGVDKRMQEVDTILQNHRSERVTMIGIWGMGGIGKTTLANAIYNKIGPTFKSRSYLENIGGKWHGENDRVTLQNQLLCDICKSTKMKINNVESGKVTLRYSLCHKKALVVLDNVDELAQLDALAGSPDWFGQGSTVIITTRNKHLLRKGCHVYMMKNLDNEESIKLFNWHVFQDGSPTEDFFELSKDIVAYSGGLPLALKELGSYFGGREAQLWNCMLEKLKKIPNPVIIKELRKSFDGLRDTSYEKVFLDISCFFIGMDKNDVTQILNGCKFDGCESVADIGIPNLEEQSLLTIDEENKLGMHDLLRDMGREIIREQSKEPGSRSRLWFHEDARAVLLEYKGTNAIEGLATNLSKSKKKYFRTKAFKKMEKLRLLHLEDVQLKGDYGYISEELRWLCWHGFPLKYIPSNFYQQKLVVIDLQYSRLTQLWKEPLELKTLKILNLSYSHDLVETPDFLKLPNLVKLILKGCPKLSMIHRSIGLLDKLILLDLEDCIVLSSLPRSIYGLKCLQTLILFGCEKINNLEEVIEQMESLTTLMAPTIKQGPFSLVRSKSMFYPIVNSHPVFMGHRLIQIGENSQVFRSLSKSVSQGLNIAKYRDDCTFPGDKHPYWRTFKAEGNSVKFKVPPINGHYHFRGMTICCLYIPPSDLGIKTCESCIISSMIIKDTKRTIFECTEDKVTSLKETEMKEIRSNLEPDNELEVKVVFRDGFAVKKIVVYLVYDESFGEQTEHLPSKATNLVGSKRKHKHKGEGEGEEEEEALRYIRPKKQRRVEI